MTRVLCVGSLYKQIKGPASKVDGSQPCSSGWLMGEGWVFYQMQNLDALI